MILPKSWLLVVVGGFFLFVLFFNFSHSRSSAFSYRLQMSLCVRSYGYQLEAVLTPVDRVTSTLYLQSVNGVCSASFQVSDFPC